jgi:hypothetical protein
MSPLFADCYQIKAKESTLIHHQGIICGVAFLPEAGDHSLLVAAYCHIRLVVAPQAPSI